MAPRLRRFASCRWTTFCWTAKRRWRRRRTSSTRSFAASARGGRRPAWSSTSRSTTTALIVIKPFDPSSVKEIERAIRTSDLGITPNSDGKLIRLPIPPLSGERRKHLAAQLKKMAEDARVAIRNIRRDANKAADKEKSDGVLPEDDADRCRAEVQKLTDEYSGKIDAMLADKNKEVMET